MTASGNVGLTGDRAIDLNVDGKLDAAALSVLATNVRTEGTATLNVAARGTIAAPELNGTVDLAEAHRRRGRAAHRRRERRPRTSRSPASRIELASLHADVNGGTLDGSGFADARPAARSATSTCS